MRREKTTPQTRGVRVLLWAALALLTLSLLCILLGLRLLHEHRQEPLYSGARYVQTVLEAPVERI